MKLIKKGKQESIPFTKMHGLGNDFAVINTVDLPFTLPALPISQLADRHVGIGFDQLLIIEPSQQADFFCRIFNADGSEAEQCGNGLRCVARFIHEEGLNRSRSLSLETKAGIYPLAIPDYDHIRVTMGSPQIHERLIELSLHSRLNPISLSILSVGNPHAIVKVASLDNLPTDQIGSEISVHSHFPNGANVGFMQIVSPHHIRLRTFERGAGETFACGSNACAAAVAGILNGWLQQQQIQVEFRYGSLFIDWMDQDNPIQMIGPASRVFTGEIII